MFVPHSFFSLFLDIQKETYVILLQFFLSPFIFFNIFPPLYSQFGYYLDFFFLCHLHSAVKPMQLIFILHIIFFSLLISFWFFLVVSFFVEILCFFIHHRHISCRQSPKSVQMFTFHPVSSGMLQPQRSNQNWLKSKPVFSNFSMYHLHLGGLLKQFSEIHPQNI